MVLIFNVTEWWDRANFGNFLNSKGLLGPAVEVGTHRGIFAKQFLSQWDGKVLHCVDPYLSGYDPEDSASTGNRGEDRQEAHRVLAYRPPGRNVKFLDMTSEDASKTFPLRSLDFVYIDACHQYKSVLQDMHLWWPRVKVGGVLAGHDILCCGEIKGGWGQYVQRAVFEFASEIPTTVHLVRERNGSPWSWILNKEGD